MRPTHLSAAVLLVSSAVGAQGIPRARPNEVGLGDAELARIAPLLKSWVDSGKFAGITAVIVRHGKLAFVTSVGSLDSARARPIAEDAVYRIYSMTKPIASVAVMQLVERGKLRVEDPVSKFIPAFANVKVYAGGGAATPVLKRPVRPVTVADLLTHTAGLTYGLFGETPVDSIYRRTNMMNPAWTIREMADSITKLPLMFEPGSAFNYSLAIDVLGHIVEVVSGTTFDRYLDTEIFRPLGMRSTGFHATPDMAQRATSVFVRGPDGKLVAAKPLLQAQYTAKGKYLSGGAGLLSTIPDYLRFTQMLLNRGELDGHRVLKRETVDLMMQNHIPASAIPILPGSPEPPGKNGFGYGGSVRMDSDLAMPGSAGTFRWSGYASTFFWIDRKADLVAMLWTQFIPEPEVWAVDGQFQKLVYAAVK
jgi:CubicO group peptidase (beta-lactamase class C family)